MTAFFTVFKFYLKRSLRDPMTIGFFFVLPLAMILLMTQLDFTAFNTPAEYDDYQYSQYEDSQNEEQDESPFAHLDEEEITVINNSFFIIVFGISFMFFANEQLTYLIFDDIKGEMRWRQLAAPVTKGTFYVASTLVTWIVILIQAVVVMGIPSLILDVYFGSPLIFFAAVFLVSLVSPLVALIISQVAKTRKMGSAISQILAFVFMFLAGVFMVPLGDSALARFATNYGTPLSLALTAIQYGGLSVVDEFTCMSTAWQRIGILAGVVVVLAALFAVIFNLKKSNKGAE
ncbi:MAG: ABC transporter permease [Oscillospiraceae bacterium]|nr:ABC transporter permease [Oscillospiraceae bacterium]